MVFEETHDHVQGVGRGPSRCWTQVWTHLEVEDVNGEGDPTLCGTFSLKLFSLIFTQS
jgi:hypothetical protein